MVPHSRHRRKRQSANILGDYCLRRRQEWGHHGGRCWPFRSRCVNRCCGLLWHVFLLGKLASEHTPTDHGGRLPSRRLNSPHAKSVDSLHQLIRDIMAAWCLVVVAVNLEEWGQETRFPTRCNFVHRSTMVVTVVVRPPWGPTPSF